MTDFYSLLKQSIIDRGISNASERDEIYKQARQAVIKQLWDFHPPLAADEIDTRVGAYDTAVERIEADLVAAFANGEIPTRKRSGAAAAAALPVPIPEPEPEEDTVYHDDLDADDAPLADWAGDEIDDEEPASEPEPAPIIERALPRTVRREPVEEPYDYEEDAAEVPHEAPAQAAAPERRSHARWNADGGVIVARARRWWSITEDRGKIQVLAGAITGLVIALGALAAFLIMSGGDGGVTVAIGGPRAVSDAATATRIASEQLEVQQTYALFDGRDPTIFETTPDNPVRFDSQSGFARVSSSASAPGVKAIIGPGLANRLAGQRVRITLVARSSGETGAGALRFAYQSGVALSHWQTASLGPTYDEVAMIWRLPAMRTNAAGDFLLIEPGIPGDGTGVDIQSIRIDVLSPETG